MTYGGRDYRIIAYEEQPAALDEPSGDLIDDAAYQHTMLIEEKYDIASAAAKNLPRAEKAIVELLEKVTALKAME